jgi:hypothetical protein
VVRGTAERQECRLVVGPNPYPLYSFLELRKGLGPAWVVCRPCSRFVPIPRGLDLRDTRGTTFSCSVCGDPGDVALEDPAKEGLQHDPRRRPLRHPMAAVRLRALHKLATGPFGHQKAARESLPQRTKPVLDRRPSFRLKPMPFTTFGELPALGLALSVYCPDCYAKVPMEISDRLAPRRWGRVRFTCSRTRYTGNPCRMRGYLYLEPLEPIAPDEPFVSMECGCRITPWFAERVQLDRPPWSSVPIDARTERYRCPGCGGQVRATFHSGGPSPERFAGHLLAPRGHGPEFG